MSSHKDAKDTGKSLPTGRAGGPSRRSLVFGEFRLDEVSGALYKGDSDVPLPPRALKILRRLLESAGEPVSKADLLDAAWEGVAVTENSLSEVIRRLRSALEDDPHNPRYIQTLHRRGYRLMVSVSVEAPELSETDRGPETDEPDRRNRYWTAPALIAVLAVAALALWLLHGRFVSAGKKDIPPLAPRFEVPLPEGAHLAPLRPGFLQPLMAVSADGRRLVYVGLDAAGVQKLFLRELDSLEVKALPGTEGASSPFFSPDGVWVAFFADGKLKKVPVSGGPATVLAPASFGLGGDWGSDGTIVFVPSVSSGLLRVSAGGGPTQVLLRRHPESESNLAWPRLLPDGRGVLFTQSKSLMGNVSIGFLSFETGERRLVLENASCPFFVPPNFLLFARDSSVWATTLDLERMATLGPPVLLEQEVTTYPPLWAAQFAASSGGVLAYATGGSVLGLKGTRVVLLDRSGNRSTLPVPTDGVSGVVPSPDGRRLALSIEQLMGVNVWVYDTLTRQLDRLTYDGSVNQPESWSPDGKSIAFDSDRTGMVQPFRKLASGSGQAEPIASFVSSAAPADWSSDGKLITFIVDGGKTGLDVWIENVETGKLRPLVNTVYREGDAKFSPDGQWVAYDANPSGYYEIYLRSLSEPAEVHELTVGGGSWPRWSPTGKELFFWRGKGLWAVDVRTMGSFRSGTAHLLFEGNFMPQYGVMPDGNHFVMVEKTTTEGPTQLVVVTNLQERLRYLLG